MALYMARKTGCGALPVIAYYRRRTQPHVSHVGAGAFTQAAQLAHAAIANVPVGAVEPGTCGAGQDVPTGGHVE